MTAEEFGLHYRMWRRDPWGTQRDALNTAQVVQAIGNYAGKTRTSPLKLEECVLKFEPKDQPPSEPEEGPDPAMFFSSLTRH